MSLCDLSTANILPTRTRSGKVSIPKPFFTLESHQFTSFQDACDWAIYYLTKLREVLESYIQAGFRTRELSEYFNQTRDTIYKTLLQTEKAFGADRRDIVEMKKFLDRMREEVIEPLKNLPIR